MSNKEFWNEEPELLWAYRKMYMDKVKIESEKNNYYAWLNGLYVFNAVSASIYNSFGRKEGQSAINYVQQPYDFSKTKEDYEQEEKLKIEEQIKERNKQIKEMLKNKK